MKILPTSTLSTGNVRGYVAIGLVALATCGYAWSAPTVQFDKFKNQTVVKADSSSGVPTAGNSYAATEIITIFEGAAPAAKAPVIVLIAFSSEHLTWRYLRCHDVNYLADGVPVHSTSTAHLGTVRIGYVEETVNSYLMWDAAKTLAAAQAVQVQVCADERPFTPIEMANLKDVVRAASPP